MAIDQENIGYLCDPCFQIENRNGKPLTGGYFIVKLAGTNITYQTLQNFDGTTNPIKAPLGVDGRCVLLADIRNKYDLYCYDSFNNLIFSRLNITITKGGAGILPGTIVVAVEGTQNEIDSVASTSTDGHLIYTVSLSETFKTNLQTDLDNLQTQIDNLQTDLNDLEGRVETNEDDIANIKNQIIAIDSRIDNLQDYVNTNFLSLLEQIVTINAEITFIKNRLTAIETRVGQLEVRMNAVEAKNMAQDAAILAAKTEVKEGNNIAITKTIGANGQDIYTVNGVESVPNVEVTSEDESIEVTETVVGNNKTFDLSVKTQIQNVKYGEFIMGYVGGSGNTPTFTRRKGDFSGGTNGFVIPKEVKIFTVNVDFNTTDAANPAVNLMYIDWTVNGVIDNDCFRRVRNISHTNQDNFSQSWVYENKTGNDLTINFILTQIVPTGSYYGAMEGYVTVVEQANNISSGGGGGEDTYKVKTTDADNSPDFLDNKIICEAPLQKKLDGDKVVLYQDPVEASPLSLICTPSMDTSIAQYGVISGSHQVGQMPGMQLHAFTLPNYYVPHTTDIFSFLNTNTQGSNSLTALYIPVFEFDFEENRLNLVCVTNNVASQVWTTTGMQNATVHYISDAYNIIKPGKIYYTGFVCDQSALQVAGGASSTTFNCNYPFLGITFHNLQNAITPELFVTNYSTIQLGTGSTINHQEGLTRGSVMIRHEVN